MDSMPRLVVLRLVNGVVLDHPFAGEVRLHLTPGSCEVTGRRSAHSLYDYELATYDADDTFRHEDSLLEFLKGL